MSQQTFTRILHSQKMQPKLNVLNSGGWVMLKTAILIWHGLPVGESFYSEHSYRSCSNEYIILSTVEPILISASFKLVIFVHFVIQKMKMLATAKELSGTCRQS